MLLHKLFYPFYQDAKPIPFVATVTEEHISRLFENDGTYVDTPCFSYRITKKELNRLKKIVCPEDIGEIESMHTDEHTTPKYNNPSIISYEGKDLYTREDMREIAQIAWIIGSELGEEIHEAKYGFAHPMDFVDKASYTFWNKHKHVGEWEEFLSSKKNKFPKAQAWDEYVILYTKAMLEKEVD